MELIASTAIRMNSVFKIAAWLQEAFTQCCASKTHTACSPHARSAIPRLTPRGGVGASPPQSRLCSSLHPSIAPIMLHPWSGRPLASLMTLVRALIQTYFHTIFILAHNIYVTTALAHSMLFSFLFGSFSFLFFVLKKEKKKNSHPSVYHSKRGCLTAEKVHTRLASAITQKDARSATPRLTPRGVWGLPPQRQSCLHA